MGYGFKSLGRNVLLVVLLQAAPASGQLLPLRHYTTESESRALPSAEVHSVYQDRLGYLWIVVYSSGLVRYDGVGMEVYTEDDGLRSVALWDVTEDAAGRLWATSNAGLVVSERPLQEYEGGRRIRFVSELGGVPLLDGGVRRNLIASDSSGLVWVGTDGLGIVRYWTAGDEVFADTLRAVTVPHGASEPVRSVVARRDGSVWVGLSGGTLLRYEGGTEPEVVRGRGSPRQSVFVLYESPKGVLWGSERGGRLWRLEERGGERTFVTVSEALSSTVHSIRAVSGNQLFVASEGAGLLVVDLQDPARQRLFTRQNGLLSDVIHAVAEDAEGNVWIAQSGGLSKLRFNYAAFTNYSARSLVGERPLLPAAAVSAVQPTPDDPACDVWLGTSGGGVACIQRGSPVRSTYLQMGDGLSSDYVNALARDSGGRVWIGTSDGINVVAPVRVAVPPTREQRRLQIGGEAYRMASYSGSTILSITSLDGAAGPGGTWFAGYKWLFGYAGGEWFRLGEATGLPPTVFHAVAADGAGHLWVGTRDRGLYRSTRPVSLASLRERAAAASGDESLLGREVLGTLFEPVWSTASGAPTDQVEALLWSDGAMWVATPAGLVVLEPSPSGAPRVTAHLDKRAGLDAPHVFSLARSPTTGTVWAGTNAGLVEIDPRAREVLRTIARRDGLIDNEVWYYGSVRIDEEGRIYFGTAKGLSIYASALDRENVLVPAVHLRRADYSENAEGYNEIVLEYAATSFASEDAVLYRTRLVGYGSAWSPPSAEAKIRYTNLPAAVFPKAYTFEVAASTGGPWSPPVAYTFHVQPPWWLAWWAISLYAVALIAGGVLVARTQRDRLMRQVLQRARLREVEHRAERAASEQAAAEARARALQAENERKEVELVKARELEQAYHELQRTQAQLIQAEKMASLGQLTAGIAHEIKNPLNFVNNFARASVELVDELREELAGPGLDAGAEGGAVKDLLGDLTMMATKIAHHGERADRIVNSMLQHSRGSGETFHEIDVNVFVEEYVNLAFHGMRAQHSEFNVEIAREYDERAGTAEVVPQELGRVLINLLNNAFYAVHEQKSRLDGPYAPRVGVRTHRCSAGVEIRIEDNGSGIPEAVRQRIFEPFFTTKPTGEGTGLGLSLSYDIVTQMHGGRLHLETEEGTGTTFVITLPARTGGRDKTAATNGAFAVVHPQAP